MEPQANTTLTTGNRSVRISFIVEKKLEQINRKLMETEDKLRSKENENRIFCSKIESLNCQLSASEHNHNKLVKENQLLKVELQKFTTNLKSACHNAINKNHVSKPEYSSPSSQRDGIFDVVKQDECIPIKPDSPGTSTLTIAQNLNEDTQNSMEKDNKEIYELRQLVSLLEFVVEETAAQNVALQKKYTSVHHKQVKRLKIYRKTKTQFLNTSLKQKSFLTKTKSTETKVCSQNKRTYNFISNQINKNGNGSCMDIMFNKPHCAVYLGLKPGRFPCRCGKDFTTKQELKDHIVNENRKTVSCSHCGRTFISKDEMESHINSFHKQIVPAKYYQKF